MVKAMQVLIIQLVVFVDYNVENQGNEMNCGSNVMVVVADD